MIKVDKVHLSREEATPVTVSTFLIHCFVIIPYIFFTVTCYMTSAVFIVNTAIQIYCNTPLT